MKNIKYTLLLALILSLDGIKLIVQIIPSAGEAKEIKLKDSEVFKTENGITVILSENHKIPRISINYAFRERTIKLKMIKLVYPLWLENS